MCVCVRVCAYVYIYIYMNIYIYISIYRPLDATCTYSTSVHDLQLYGRMDLALAPRAAQRHPALEASTGCEPLIGASPLENGRKNRLIPYF